MERQSEAEHVVASAPWVEAPAHASGTVPDTGEITPDMALAGWGDPAHHRELPGAIKQVIARYLRVREAPVPAPDPAAVELVPSAFAAQAGSQGGSQGEQLAGVLSQLRAAVGAQHVHLDDRTRLARAGGKSFTDLMVRRAPGAQWAPDAVVRPGCHEEVVAVLGICAAAHVAVVPFGGGTSVVGGVDGQGIAGFAAVISLDLHRLTQLSALDRESGLATLGAGLSGAAADALLRRHGYILGHYPQSFEYASLGGFAATRSSGQASLGYGRFDSKVERLTVATPAGTLRLGRAPASAAGPDLRQLMLGSEGAFGVITDITLRVDPIPAQTLYEAWEFPSFEAGASAVRDVAQSDFKPTVLRLSDELETRINFALGGDVLRAAKRRCIAITTYEGPTKDECRARRAMVAGRFRTAGGTSLGGKLARAWEGGRYKAPYMRDPALDMGVIVETFETATEWSRVLQLHRAVIDAVAGVLRTGGHRALVWCHISHEYPTGASLYFTAAAPGGPDPIGLWARAKKAAGDVIVAHGATISHHHAVGRDHRPWLEAEIGSLGVEVLRSVKRTLDPTGICNPGALIPDILVPTEQVAPEVPPGGADPRDGVGK